MKRVIAVAVVLSALSGLAYAGELPKDDPLVILDNEKKQEHKAVDQQYQRALRSTTEKASDPVRVDPWANMRGADDSKAKK